MPSRNCCRQYPANLNTVDLYYFMLAPTLCYELNFPRTAKIRWNFVAKRLTECLLIFAIVISIGQQWIQPTVSNTMTGLTSNTGLSGIFYLASRTLKLALPNNLTWLLMFYMYFHSFLNATAEMYGGSFPDGILHTRMLFDPTTFAGLKPTNVRVIQ